MTSTSSQDPFADGHYSASSSASSRTDTTQRTGTDVTVTTEGSEAPVQVDEESTSSSPSGVVTALVILFVVVAAALGVWLLVQPTPQRGSRGTL